MTAITGTAGPRPQGQGMVHAPVSPGRPPGMPAGGITAQDVMRVLKRWVWVMVMTFVMIMILTAVGTYIWATWYPSFMATALIEVKAPDPPPIMAQRGTVANVQVIEQYMNSQVAIIRSLPTMSKALNSPRIKNSSWYKRFGKDVGGRLVGVVVEDAITDMEKRRLTVWPVRDTQLISVSFSWRDAAEAAEIANVVVETYYEDVSRAASRSTREALNTYTARAESLRGDLIIKREKQQAFRARHKIPVLQQTRSDVGEQVNEINKLLAGILTDKAQIEALYDQYHLRGAMEQMVETPEMRMRIEMDPKVRQFEFEQSSGIIAMDTLTKRYGINHRSVRDLQMRLDAVDMELNATRSKLRSDVFNDARETTASNLDQINAQVLNLNNRLA